MTGILAEIMAILAVIALTIFKYLYLIWGILFFLFELISPGNFNLRFLLANDLFFITPVIIYCSFYFSWERKINNILTTVLTLGFLLVAIKWDWVLLALKVIHTNEFSLAAILRWPSLIFVLIATLALAINLSHVASKVLKRSIEIRPLNIFEGEKELVVGAFKSEIIPPDIREFITAKDGDKISLPTSLATSGISILGDPGSGKSRLMRRLHDEIRRLYPDIPILIHDPKGEWLRTYYDPATDLIFSPYDKRSVSWDIFSEIKNRPQLQSSIIATAVNQHHGDGDDNLYWINSAVDIIKEQKETKKPVAKKK
jgi:hypothetical protein